MMKKQNKIYLAIGIVAVVLIAAIAMFSMPKGEETIKIGAVLPLSGVVAFSGQQTQIGMKLAMEEINLEGGINGKKIELVFEDSEGSNPKGISSFNKILQFDNPNIMISSLSGVSNSLAPLAKENQIPLLAIVTSDPNVASNEWVFRYYPTAEQEIKPVVYAINQINAKKTAILYLNDDFGKSMLEELKNNFDGEIIAESFNIGAGDFRTELTKIKSETPDVLLVVGFASHTSNSIKQAKEMGINSLFVSTSVLAFPDVINSLGNIGDGIYLGAPSLYYEQDTLSQEFASAMRQKYPKAQVDHYTANGYDAIMLLKQIFEEKGFSKLEIKEGLQNLQSFDGVLGKTEINGRKFSFPLYTGRIESGSITYLENP